MHHDVSSCRYLPRLVTQQLRARTKLRVPNGDIGTAASPLSASHMVMQDVVEIDVGLAQTLLVRADFASENHVGGSAKSKLAQKRRHLCGVLVPLLRPTQHALLHPEVEGEHRGYGSAFDQFR